jgi:cellobiose-specific phosphotransferase system component IIC
MNINKKNNYKEMSNEDLLEKQKKFKVYVSILGILTLILLFFLGYFAVKENNFNLAVLCGGTSFSLLLCSIILKQIETELKFRKLK